uniref:Probable DNA polymerase n=1 Tax=Dactylella sp. TaxID=1814903 RepID=A0A482DTQ2_9PEZI|nr:hypothetical protein [Dactylella sp.]
MDFETRKKDNEILEPLCLCLYDGKEKKVYKIDDYENPNEMVKDGIGFLMKRKYYGWKVYFHNFSSFDGVFLLRLLAEMGNVKKPIIKDNKMIEIRFNFGRKATIHFHDSYLMLPVSQKKIRNCI